MLEEIKRLDTPVLILSTGTLLLFVGAALLRLAA